MTKEVFTEADWRRLLEHLGEDPDRPGLIETPHRVHKAWKHWVSGYGQDPAEVLKAFEDGAEQYNELIVVKNIPVYSHCEHHLAPFFGKATVGYVPNGKIVGLSKLTRLRARNLRLGHFDRSHRSRGTEPGAAGSPSRRTRRGRRR